MQKLWNDNWIVLLMLTMWWWCPICSWIELCVYFSSADFSSVGQMIIFTFESDAMTVLCRLSLLNARELRCLHFGRSFVGIVVAVLVDVVFIKYHHDKWRSSRASSMCGLENEPHTAVCQVCPISYCMVPWRLLCQVVVSGGLHLAFKMMRHTRSGDTHFRSENCVLLCGWFQGKLRAHRKLKLAQRCERHER